MKRLIWLRVRRILSYVLVIAITVVLTMALGFNKIGQLKLLIKNFHVDGDSIDYGALEDAAATAMMDALPDGWSYYVSAEEYQAFVNNRANVFVGIGVHIQQIENEIHIVKVTSGGPAEKAGVLPGDILQTVDATSVAGMTTAEVSALVQGEEGTNVTIVVLRNGETLSFTLTRTEIQVQVVTSDMLEGNIGYIRIENFCERSADEAIAAVEDLRSRGAVALIFDVRGNGGGFKSELVKLLDHLLPEGVLFRSINYNDQTEVDKSDAACVNLPMAVLMDGYSYSAAEFFPAALAEYNWAITVGEPTVGKGHFQETFLLPDGSAAVISTGKYFTPNGVNLSEVGGLTPDVPVAMEDTAKAKLYSGVLDYAEDPQLQAAITALTN